MHVRVVPPTPAARLPTPAARLRPAPGFALSRERSFDHRMGWQNERSRAARPYGPVGAVVPFGCWFFGTGFRFARAPRRNELPLWPVLWLNGCAETSMYLKRL
jgi:hypothetical protein